MKKTKHFSLYLSDNGKSYLGAKFETTLETEDGEETTDEELGERVLKTTLDDFERAKKENPVVREIYRAFVKGVKKTRKVDKAFEELG